MNLGQNFTTSRIGWNYVVWVPPFGVHQHTCSWQVSLHNSDNCSWKVAQLSCITAKNTVQQLLKDYCRNLFLIFDFSSEYFYSETRYCYYFSLISYKLVFFFLASISWAFILCMFYLIHLFLPFFSVGTQSGLYTPLFCYPHKNSDVG